MKIRLLISYQGTEFYGWQKQSTARTVQGEMEKALSRLFQRPVTVIGSGRTDTGVHAFGQTAHFEIPDSSRRVKDTPRALNHLTPPDISIQGAWRAPEEFHARFSVEKKTYSFFLSTSSARPALCRDLVWWTPIKPDLRKLQQVARVLLGEKDFKSFQTGGSPVKDTVKTIYSARWREQAPSFYRFDITGSGFLKQMVRNLVGAQLSVLKEKSPEKVMEEILKRRDRKAAPAPAPGKGLYLKEVFYPPPLDRKCRRI